MTYISNQSHDRGEIFPNGDFIQNIAHIDELEENEEDLDNDEKEAETVLEDGEGGAGDGARGGDMRMIDVDGGKKQEDERG